MSSHSFAHAGRAGAGDRAVLAASAHLTERDRSLVRLVGQHRVLTTDQLAAFAFTNVITARHRLGVLVKIGVLRRFRPHREVGSAPWHYLLGPVGAALLGAEDRDDKRWLPQVRADRQLALAGSQRLGHLVGANWFFVSLAAHARRSEDGELRQWLGEQDTIDYLWWRLPAHHHRDSLPHPDGLGTWAEHGGEVTFVLEYDTGTEHLPRLAGKLEGYARLAEALARFGHPGPVLLFCFPTPRREQAARRTLAACQDAAGLRIATTALDPQATCPAGPVWLPLPSTAPQQVRLAALETAIPHPWADHRAQQPHQAEWTPANGPAGEDTDDPYGR